MSEEKRKNMPGLNAFRFFAVAHTPSSSPGVNAWLESLIHSKNQCLVSGQLKKKHVTSSEPEPVI